MSYNIIRKELRLNRRSFLVWAGVVLLIIAIYLPFFPYMQDPEFAKLLEGYPDTIKDAFNITGSLFQDINLYYAGMVMQYALLLALIYTAMLAGRLIRSGRPKRNDVNPRGAFAKIGRASCRERV